jgi:hypothetical protein
MVILFMLCVIIGGIILRGWVLSTLWAWFLVPQGVFPISVNAAIGISVLIGLFTQHLVHDTVKVDKKSTADMITTITGKTIGGPLMALLVGWIVTLFA